MIQLVKKVKNYYDSFYKEYGVILIEFWSTVPKCISQLGNIQNFTHETYRKNMNIEIEKINLTRVAEN